MDTFSEIDATVATGLLTEAREPSPLLHWGTRMDDQPARSDRERFWQLADSLVATSKIIVDRPRGSLHPYHSNVVYPLDYGYLAQTGAVDGGGVDAWIGTLPERRVTGVIVTIDALKRDAEVKLLISCTLDEAGRALAVHTTGSQVGVLLWRTHPV